MEKLKRNELGFVTLKKLQDLHFDIPPSSRRSSLLNEPIVNHAYKGFEYVLHKRSDRIALFSQLWDGIFLGYEVVIYKYYPERIIKGRLLKERFAHPKDEDWGDYGWTYKDPNKAEAKFRELEKLTEAK